MVSNCGAGEDSWESLGQQGHQTSILWFSKGNQPWIFLGRTDAEVPILWPPHVKSQLIRQDPDAGKGWRQEEKGMTEDEMVRWHPWLNGHEFKQALGDGEGQGSLVCCSPRDLKESDTTEWATTTMVDYMIWVGWMQNLEYKGLTVKLYVDFWLCGGSVFLLGYYCQVGLIKQNWTVLPTLFSENIYTRLVTWKFARIH